LFVSKDVPSFEVIQMMVATLVLAAVITLIVNSQSLADYWRSHWKARPRRQPMLWVAKGFRQATNWSSLIGICGANPGPAAGSWLGMAGTAR
jgi:hypothetical protein